MKKSELIRRIKAGAIVYVPLATHGGKDWEYVQANTESLLYDLQSATYNKCFINLPCDANEKNLAAPVWFEPPVEKK